MRGLDLTQLFEQPVFVSFGKTGDDDLKNLTKLAVEETPSGFNNWVQKRQREYRCGRHHARRALSAAGLSVTAITRDEDGLPVFPSGFHGSITHTGRSSTFAAAVVAAAPLRVGIDAEDLRTLPEDMIAHIVSDDERARFAPFAAIGGPGSQDRRRPCAPRLFRQRGLLQVHLSKRSLSAQLSRCGVSPFAKKRGRAPGSLPSRSASQGRRGRPPFACW